MNYLFRYIFILFVSLASIQNAKAQVKNSGKDFYVTLGNFEKFVYVEIASKHNANVTLYYTNLNKTNNYSVSAGSFLAIELDTAEKRAISSYPYGQITNRSLHITSDSDIVVSMTVANGGSSDDATVILPKDEQNKATAYYLLGLGKSRLQIGNYGYTLVATEDSVVFDISLTTPSVSFYPTATIMLNKGETYHVATPAAAKVTGVADFSGSSINILSKHDCFPLAVYHSTRARYATWPMYGDTLYHCCADALLEQLQPADWWDTSYKVAAFEPDSFSILRIVSASQNNDIYLDGQFTATLNKGQVLDTIVYNSKPLSITSQYPIGIMEIMTSYDVGATGDPSVLWVQPYSQAITRSIFSTHYSHYVTDTVSHTLTIICPSTAVNDIRLNNSQIGNMLSTFPNNNNWYYGNIKVAKNKTFELRSAQPILAYYFRQVKHGSFARQLADMRTFGTAAIEDTVYLCGNGPLTLTARYAKSYQWSTGHTSQSIQITTPGKYTVHEYTNDGCILLDIQHSFLVKQIAGNDSFTKTITKCENTSITLSADSADHYLWSNGAVTKDIVATLPGKYIAKAYLNYPCPHSKTYLFEVKNKTNDTITNSNTIILCPDTGVLEAKNAHYYEWSTGANTMHITVKKPGSYWAKATDTILCTTYFTQFEVLYRDTIIKTETILICSLDLLLSAPEASSYNWSSGETSRNITVSFPGTYSVAAVTENPCKVIIYTFIVKDIIPVNINLSNAITICDGEEVVLHSGYTNTIWSTGEVGPEIQVSQQGIYHASVIDSCNIQHSAHTAVNVKSCIPCLVNFPSAFTPNGDGINDIFKVISNGQAENYQLKIFNRFGELVYNTETINEGWNGFYKGDKAEVSTYYYFCTYYCPFSLENIMIKGDVLLLR